MTRCTCKTQKGEQCKKDAVAGTKTCVIHKKCKSVMPKTKKSGLGGRMAAGKVTAKKAAPKRAVPKAKPRRTKALKGEFPDNLFDEPEPRWTRSKAWESPVPTWMKGAEKVRAKPLSPKRPSPLPEWLAGAEKVKTTPLSPKKPSPLPDWLAGAEKVREKPLSPKRKAPRSRRSSPNYWDSPDAPGNF